MSGLVYEFAGEILLSNPDRECGHPYIQEAGDCELCDVDWLEESDEEEEAPFRDDIVFDIRRKAGRLP